MVPIVSLRKRFGLPSAEDGISSCIAVMDFQGQLTGFVIDEVSDVIRIARKDILPPPRIWRTRWRSSPGW